MTCNEIKDAQETIKSADYVPLMAHFSHSFDVFLCVSRLNVRQNELTTLKSDISECPLLALQVKNCTHSQVSKPLKPQVHPKSI
jgi:hypothetical protein